MMLASFTALSEPINIDEGSAATLVIEEPIFYRGFIEGLRDASEGLESDFVLSENNIISDFGKNVCLITDIFGIDLASRSIASKILHAVSAEAGAAEDEVMPVLSELNSLAFSLSSRLGYDISYKSLTDLSGVLKLFDFAVDTEGMSLCDRLIQYADIMSSDFGKRLFVTVNLKSALSEDEQASFFRTIAYKKHRFLLIENMQHAYRADNETIRIIDRDLCEIC